MASSATTNPRRTLPTRRPSPECGPRSTPIRSIRAPCSAGTRPNTSPHSTVIPTMRTTAAGSTPISWTPRIDAGTRTESNRVPPTPSDNPERTTQPSQDQTLRQQLPDDPHPARAEGGADTELPGARRGAHHGQAGEIDTRQQEHGCDGTDQGKEGGTHRSDQLLMQRYQPRPDIAVGGRILRHLPGEDSRHLLLGLGDGGAGASRPMACSTTHPCHRCWSPAAGSGGATATRAAVGGRWEEPR